MSFRAIDIILLICVKTEWYSQIPVFKAQYLLINLILLWIFLQMCIYENQKTLLNLPIV